MKEDQLYPILKDYLEGKGYYPVKITPSIRIRGYRPDVTGLKGKEVLCVEAKPEFNEYRIMEAVTQAKIYMLGTTHVFVAFPSPSEKKEKDLLKFLETICKDYDIGIYLIDVKTKKVDKLLNAKFSKYLSLPDYDDVLQQLEEKELLILENTYPEYIRDICIYFSREFKTKSVTKKDLIDSLEGYFDRSYWLYKSGARGPKQNQYVKNRIEKTIEGAIQLGFIEIENEDKLRLSYSGYLFAQLDNEVNRLKPKELSEQRTFLTAYLLRYPVFRKSIRILSETKDFMFFGWSKCKHCGYKHWDVKKFKILDNSLLCPKC